MGFLSRLFGTDDEDAAPPGALEAYWDDREMVLRLSTCERKNIRDKQYIYGLYNHGTGRMFYVGRTSSPHRRWKQHIESANPRGNPKERYIAKMRSRNKPPFDIPAMVILEECSSLEVKAREVYWQKKFLKNDMTNIRIG